MHTQPTHTCTMPLSITLENWDDCSCDALDIRFNVFVDEQGVPAEMERDEWDAVSLHAIASDAHGKIIGTGRLLPDGHIGRMAVARHARGQGAGSAILEALIAAAQEQGIALLRLNAQLQATPFYVRHGFTPYGEVFDDAGLPHIAMQLRLSA